MRRFAPLAAVAILLASAHPQLRGQDVRDPASFPRLRSEDIQKPATTDAVPTGGALVLGEPADGLVRVFPLERDDAESLASLLRSLFDAAPGSPRIVAHARTNCLVVRAAEAELRQIDDLIKILDGMEPRPTPPSMAQRDKRPSGEPKRGLDERGRRDRRPAAGTIDPEAIEAIESRFRQGGANSSFPPYTEPPVQIKVDVEADPPR